MKQLTTLNSRLQVACCRFLSFDLKNREAKRPIKKRLLTVLAAKSLVDELSGAFVTLKP